MKRTLLFGFALLLVMVGLRGLVLGADTIRFAAFGDYGDDDADQAAVAALVVKLAPDFIITTGDNSYGANPIDDSIGKYYGDYIGNYSGSYGPGSTTNRFFPSLGNHDWDDGGGIAAYTAYFTLPGNERYYDFVSGPVHFFVVGSDDKEPDGNTFDSVQGNWLKAALANSTAPFKVVYMHHPPYSSSSVHGSEKVMQWPFEEWGASAVLAGHDHTYERIFRDDNGDGTFMPYFVTGLGGRSLYRLPNSGFVKGSQVRYNDNYGTLLVTATDTTLTFEFHSVENGGTLIDSYALSIAGEPAPDPDPPSADESAAPPSGGCVLRR